MTSELVTELWKLRAQAGQPSFQLIADNSLINRRTVLRLFNGRQAPRWQTVRNVTVFLGGDCEKVFPLWQAAASDIRRSPRQPGAGLPPLGTPLTEFELKVLVLLSYGDSQRIMASNLGHHVHVIKERIRFIYARLGAKNGPHAVRLGLELGYLELSHASKDTDVVA